MNITGYNLETLREKIRNLQEENNKLKELLKKSNIVFGENINTLTNDITEYNEDQGACIKDQYITSKMAAFFLTIFQGRRDVYALRGSRGGYFPQCINRWNNVCPKQNNIKISCTDCQHKQWKELNRDIGLNHLLGYKDNCTDVIGIYPLLENDTCKFIVFDFDNHDEENIDNSDWKDEVDALRKICEENNIDILIERSRSGNGAHAWIIFTEFIPASLARDFGYLLIEKGAASINLKSFRYYDRMFPTQDHSQGLGNVIALPLQGKALKNGNSAFVDENWNAYYDQWLILNKFNRLTKNDIERYIKKWKIELAEGKGLLINPNREARIKPWKKEEGFYKEDVVEKMTIVLADGIYIDALNLKPRIQNQIRSLVAFDNPIFYKNNRLGYSNWNQPMVVYMGRDVNDYIKIPRGLMEKIVEKCSQANILYEIVDKRERGKPIDVEFKGQLKNNQVIAEKELLKYDNGILNATTAFGKTVVASHIISKRKVSTLIIMQSVNLINQWVEELHKFLDINEELPTYQTKTGKIKTRADVIGVLYGNKNTLTGIIDVVSVNSIYDKNGKSKLKDSYGMVIVDECHHGASTVFESVINKINSKYVYGVSANDKRIDRLEKKVYMLIGPIRYQFTSKQRIEQQNIDHYVYPRFTRVINLGDSKQDINSAYLLIAKSTIRNEMIISDVKECIKNKRTPIVLTRYKEHAKYLYDVLKKDVLDNTFLIYGDNTQKKNEEVRKQLLEINQNESFILVATSQSVGEGFNVPRLDTLFITTPVSGEPLVEQFLGRINRDYKFKESAIVYDYVDLHINFFNNMYKKRLRAYRKIGFDVITNVVNNKQEVHHIYNYNDYFEIFAQDIHEANKEIIVCSPQLDEKKIFEFIDLVKNKQEKGITVIVITKNPNDLQFDNPDYANYLICHLKQAGIIVELYENLDNHYALIDQEIVWHGGINLLGRPDIYDNLIRLKSVEIATELLTLDKNE